MIKVKEVFANEGDSLCAVYPLRTKKPAEFKLDMQGVDRPYPSDIAREIELEPGFGEWVPATATSNTATINWQAAWELKESRIHEHITVYGVEWWATRESLLKMEDAVSHHTEMGFAAGYKQKWRLPDNPPRLTTVAEMKEVMKQIRMRWKTVEDSYTLWTEGDKQTPWVYP